MTEVDTTIASFSKLLDWFVELFETKIRTHYVKGVMKNDWSDMI